MLKRPVEMPSDVVGRSDHGLADDTCLPCRVQLVDLEVDIGIGCVFLMG